MTLYYLDTSIWLDFFENRNEPNFPKGDFAKDFINIIIKNNDKIVYTDLVIDEMKELNYSDLEIEDLFNSLKSILIFIEIGDKYFGRGKDIAVKRNIPLLDAMHALAAREHKAILITRDSHFKKMTDIIKTKKPEDFI